MSDGGKGSAPRPFSVDRETFEDNWDRIFSKNKKEVSSVGRASPLQGECHRFEPGTSYQTKNEDDV